MATTLGAARSDGKNRSPSARVAIQTRTEPSRSQVSVSMWDPDTAQEKDQAAHDGQEKERRNSVRRQTGRRVGVRNYDGGRRARPFGPLVESCRLVNTPCRMATCSLGLVVKAQQPI